MLDTFGAALALAEESEEEEEFEVWGKLRLDDEFEELFWRRSWRSWDEPSDDEEAEALRAAWNDNSRYTSSSPHWSPPLPSSSSSTTSTMQVPPERRASDPASISGSSSDGSSAKCDSGSRTHISIYI
jgi:hypothetical protein